MPELTNVRSVGDKGALKFQRAQDNGDLFVIGATTGIPFGATNQSSTIITSAYTLSPSTDCGYTIICSTDAIVVTLPTIAASTAGIEYTLVNTASAGGALLELKTGSVDDYVVIGGTATATTNLVLANTKATQKYGDTITIEQGIATGTTHCWITVNKVGTWVAQAAT